MKKPEFLANIQKTFSELWAALPAESKGDGQTEESAFIWTAALFRADDDFEAMSRNDCGQLVLEGREPQNTLEKALWYWEDQYEAIEDKDVALANALARIREMWSTASIVD